MKQNTRFVPTISGPLHCGHLAAILVNECEAHSSGGAFRIRMDDAQPYWIAKLGRATIRQYTELIVQDLQWVGVGAESVVLESDLHENVRRLLLEFNNGPLPVREARFNEVLPQVIQDTDFVHYPYAPWLTADKVVFDYMEGTNTLVRGFDLLGEFSLYSYFCDVWGIGQRTHWYVPRLTITGKDGNEIEFSDISKTSGNLKLCDLRRAGTQPERLLQVLAEAYLIDPEHGWHVTNVKPHPVLTYGSI